MTGGSDEQILMPPPHIYVERTLAIIKPDALHKAEEIEDIILRSGFAILQKFGVRLTGQNFHIINSSPMLGQLLLLCCSESLRAIYGTDDQRNALHGSDGLPSAQREIRFFFPDSVVEPVATGQAAKDYLSKAVNPTLLKGLTELCKQKPEDPVIWLADWLLKNNPNKPKVGDCAIVEEPQ
ncbi:nucleoside diphosphate kinase homolog 5-like [Babylonia areolata]|uniref:nucleoside diphosphate kinase homolog 5-like n=1 Tax=Babylonia areolata TaxID=304850 RepID=UPI003FD399EA